MDIVLSIRHLHPTLGDEDYRVEDHGNGPEITWLNEIITQPTQAELESAWLQVVALQEIEALKGQKSADIALIASLTDQLNLLGAVCYKLTEGNTDPDILAARKTYEDIQAVLNS